ncbi:MAG: ComF family protein [Patescibacteria group bacterium]|jgi:ComF family protein
MLLDYLFPIRCLGECGAWDQWLCPRCEQKIKQKNKIIFKEDNIYLSGLYFLHPYSNSLIQKLIHQLKYQYSEEIAKILGRNMALCLDQNFDYIIPIPLNKKRFCERGFNQSELMAENIINYSVGTYHGMSLRNDILTRTRNTAAQAQLGHELRAKNIHNAFSLNKKTIHMVSGKKILLIDDVYTTGATMNACAKLLKENRAKEIWGITAAKG